MRLLSPFLLLLCLATAAHAQYVKVLGVAEKSGSALVSGISSTNKPDITFPLSTITIYNAGTILPATIYSTATGTVKANPFTANSDASFDFFIGAGFLYDVKVSGVSNGVTITPFTRAGYTAPGIPGITQLVCGGTADTSLLAAASALGGTIQIPKSITCASNSQTLSAALQVDNGGLLKPITGQTVTLTGPQIGGHWQRFTNATSGLGTISFTGNIYLSNLLGEWWGAKADNTVDCGAAFLATQAAAKTIAVGVPVRLLAGTYKVTSQKLTPFARMAFIGEGPGISNINWNGSGYWIDEQVSALTNNVDRGHFEGFTVNVSSAGTGFLRLGDRTSIYTDAHYHDKWLFRDLEVYGQAVASSMGIDLTEMINLRADRVLVNNFDTNYNLTTLADSTFVKITSQSSTSRGIWIHGNQPSAIAVGTNGTVFVGTIINGLTGTGIGLHMDAVSDVLFSGGFIENSSGTTTAIKTASALKTTFDGLSFSGNAAYANVLDISDSAITFKNCTMSNLQDVTSTSSITWSAANRTYATWNYQGGVQFDNCSYSLTRQVAGIPWVTVLPTGGGAIPGNNAGKQPISDQTSLWAKQILNLQGPQNISETSLLLDANHSQSFYDNLTAVKIITDTNASVGSAIQLAANETFGFEIPYPSEFRPGTYELIGRLRTVSGTGTPTATVSGVGVGILVTEPFTAASATTSYQTFSLRFEILSPAIGASTAIRAYFVAVAPLVVDYVALRPAQNDIYLGPYSPPDLQLNNSAGGSENGQRIFSATVMPASGVFNIGDFAYNKAVTTSGLLGWSRITKGSNNVLGTDWIAVYGVAGLIPGEGAVLTISGNAIAPTNAIHQVGAGLIKNITLPTGFVSGTVEFVPTAAFTYDATGNCLGTGTAVVGRTMFATYSPSTGKWTFSY